MLETQRLTFSIAKQFTGEIVILKKDSVWLFNIQPDYSN